MQYLNMERVWLVTSVEALEQVAREIIAALGEKRKIAVYGEMGAGKTTFVKAFCRTIGITGATASPTFSLINQYSYKSADGSLHLLHHLDLYRLKSAQEALDIGIEDVLYDPWYCLIEWPQVIEIVLPEDRAVIDITIIDEQTRKITLQ
jgi:tRNA threonylcarbamoyladenosine biosynthesis protein TsaE